MYVKRWCMCVLLLCMSSWTLIDLFVCKAASWQRPDLSARLQGYLDGEYKSLAVAYWLLPHWCCKVQVNEFVVPFL